MCGFRTRMVLEAVVLEAAVVLAAVVLAAVVVPLRAMEHLGL